MKSKSNYIKKYIKNHAAISSSEITAMFFAVIAAAICFSSVKVVPYLAKYNNKWETISKEISNTPNGGSVTVFMGDTTKLPETITEKIAGKNINLILEMDNGITWTINGMSVTQPKTVSLGVSANTNNIPIDAIKNVSNKKGIQLSLNYNGEFGFTAAMTIKLSPKNNGLFANLFYYNPETKKLEFTNCGLIKNSMAEIKFNHASDYILIIDKMPLGAHDKTVSNIFTSSRQNTYIFDKIITYPICIAALLIIACVGIVIIIEFLRFT